MAGSHLAPSSSSKPNKSRSHAAEPERSARSRARERSYDPDYDLDYEDQGYEEYEQPRASRSRSSRQYRDDGYGEYYGGGNDGGGGGKWKTVLLVVLLVVVLAAIGFLLWRLFGSQIMGLFGGGKEPAPVAAEVAPGITAQFTAESENGKNLSGSMTITESTKRLPEDLADTDDAKVVDVTWTDNKAPEEPVYVTVSDPSFPDDEGLAVYSYTEDELIPDEGEWTQIGTYAIRNNSVTFRAEEPAAFAYRVISANPAPVDTPAPSELPSPSPMPTPVATPAPIAAIDYGVYGEAQSGVFAEVDEIEDDEVYVMALVSNMPTEADELSDEGDTTEDDADTGSTESTDGGMTISYVDAGAGTVAPEAGVPLEGADQTPAQSGPVASVLLNIDGTNMRTVDMDMFQTEDGAWCLDGSAITAGMLWTSNRDYYNSGYRYSLENNDAYINLGDGSEAFILNDNHIRTRFLIEDVEKDDGSTVRTVTYGDDGTHYINSMEMIPDAVTPDDFPATGNASGDDVQGQVIPSGHVLYLGSGLMPESDAVARDLLQFTTSKEPNDALQVMLFKLDDSIQVPVTASAEGATAPAGHILVPAIDETTNLSLLQIKDGDTVLQNGIDYTVNARVYNDTVVVTVRFMGNYAGQIVRTYPGTKVLCNDVFAEVSPSPEPSATPAPSSTPGQTEATAAPTATPLTGTEPGPVQPTQEPAPQESTPTPAQSTPTPPQSTPNPTQEPAPGGNEGSSGGDSETDTPSDPGGSDSETDANA